jgi:hypothetical protein
MDEMTQHDGALVEETNAAIEQTEAQAVELDNIVDVFKIDAAGETRAALEPKATPVKSGIRALQQKVKSAAKSYLRHGNAAVKQDWSVIRRGIRPPFWGNRLPKGPRERRRSSTSGSFNRCPRSGLIRMSWIASLPGTRPRRRASG